MTVAWLLILGVFLGFFSLFVGCLLFCRGAFRHLTLTLNRPGIVLLESLNSINGLGRGFLVGECSRAAMRKFSNEICIIFVLSTASENVLVEQMTRFLLLFYVCLLMYACGCVCWLLENRFWVFK